MRRNKTNLFQPRGLWLGLVLLGFPFAKSGSAWEGHDAELWEKCGVAPHVPGGLFKGSGLPDSLPGFGYGYDTLVADLGEWENSPYVQVSSLGKSVEQREIYLVTITEEFPPHDSLHVITQHNRTHPLEVQSWWVQNEMIKFLLSDDPEAKALRQKNVYYMIPMINPDGVELMNDCDAGFGRCNSLGVDLEREWATTTPQPEAQAVKDFYLSLMESTNPIDVALNFHSAFGCERYFWYHEAGGTSEPYAEMERLYIGHVVHHSDGAIAPWNTNTSWAVAAPDYFPESWFWFNYNDEVLALTYEDVKDCEAKETGWEIPAMALLRGTEDYLNGVPLSIRAGREYRLRATGPRVWHEILREYDLRGRGGPVGLGWQKTLPK